MAFPGFAETPVRLPSQETFELWQKAISNPENLTFDDRQRILQRSPYDEANNICRSRCGLSIDELLQKAINSPDELSRIEADIIDLGPKCNVRGYRDPGDELSDFLRWPADLRGKYTAAVDVAQTDIDKKAMKNARKVQMAEDERYRAASRRISDDDSRNFTRCNRYTPWVEAIENGEQPWGFICFRASFGDDAKWNHFQEHFRDATITALLSLRTKTQFLRDQWKIQWVEDRALENVSLDDLCKHFRTMRSEGKIESGVRQDAFLFADAAAIQSASNHYPLPKRGWVVAADPEHDSSKSPTDHHGFTGTVRVALTSVFLTFHARLAPRGAPDDEPALTRTLGRQAWDLVYFKSQYERLDQVYPPQSIVNWN